jgi:hypothetical protein
MDDVENEARLEQSTPGAVGVSAFLILLYLSVALISAGIKALLNKWYLTRVCLDVCACVLLCMCVCVCVRATV